MPRFILAALLAFATGCASGAVRVRMHDTKTPTADGHHVWSYLLLPADAPPAPPPAPRAVVFYVGGSGYDRRSSVLNPSVVGGMASFVALGMPVVLLERRGLEPDGQADTVLARRYSSVQTRVDDALGSMRNHLTHVPPGTPVVVVADSEGGGVAAAMARAEPRVTHLVLLATGGGMTHGEELGLLFRDPRNGGTPEQFEAAVADIRANPDSDREWLGHPYRRWSSALWRRTLDDLLAVNVHVFLAQGDRDTNVPVESARLVRVAFDAQGQVGRLRYCEYAGLDHHFEDEAGRSRFGRVARDVVGWLRDRALLEDGEASRLLERMRDD